MKAQRPSLNNLQKKEKTMKLYYEKDQKEDALKDKRMPFLALATKERLYPQFKTLANVVIGLDLSLKTRVDEDLGLKVMSFEEA